MYVNTVYQKSDPTLLRLNHLGQFYVTLFKIYLLDWRFIDVQNLDTVNSTIENVFIGGFPVEVPMFHSFRHSLSQLEFKMDFGLVTSAKLFLRRVAKDTGAQLFVGMHVRRDHSQTTLTRF